MVLPGLILDVVDLFPIKAYIFLICLPPLIFASLVDPLRMIYRRIFWEVRTAYFGFSLDDFIENLFSFWILLMLGFAFFVIKFSAEKWIKDI